jgi:hypothetical protein
VLPGSLMKNPYPSIQFSFSCLTDAPIRTGFTAIFYSMPACVCQSSKINLNLVECDDCYLL